MKTALLLILLAGSHTADAYWTNHNMTRHGREYNPLQRPFVHGTAWCYSSFELSGAAVYLGGRLLRHHPKAALSFELSDIAGHSAGAAISFAERKPKRR